MHRRTAIRSLIAAALGLGLVACRQEDRRPVIPAELRSWVVLGRGRHLYLQIMPTPGFRELAGRVEYTAASQRDDYTAPVSVALAGRVARMTPGVHLRPIFGVADDRIEARYWLTAAQARELQRDRVFASPYVLVGTNSNTGLARAMKDAGLTLPDRVSQGGGVLGEFPGIDLDVGEDVPKERWASFGIGFKAAH